MNMGSMMVAVAVKLEIGNAKDRTLYKATLRYCKLDFNHQATDLGQSLRGY